jgi:predicted AAA+ superfamily ATPase
LEPWHVNPGKRLIKTPKLYFQDTGLLLYLLGFGAWSDVPSNPAWGAVWENVVVAECRKAIANSPRQRPLFYWRTASGEEVDLLIELGHRRVGLFEIKAAERPGKSELKGLDAFARLYGPETVQNGRGFIVCRTPTRFPIGPGSAGVAVPLPEAVDWIGSA